MASHRQGNSEGINLEEIAPLLWDTDISQVDPVRHKKVIIERVLKYGNPKEIRWLLAHYADADIIAVVKNSLALDRKTANFWAIHYGIPLEEVRCLHTTFLNDCFY